MAVGGAGSAVSPGPSLDASETRGSERGGPERKGAILSSACVSALLLPAEARPR
eukprot:CAMPEP_0182877212 /NCGR_PEP_ID=MMETSP0034_2-20130328/14617_1 /TAXON_ID=156128 /ORGANISM="Nephroselmis pyriformis, Strain CCMP717" /LENGTH=53 /DNA_ID=CAMNT_0025010043 /DNA_START=150 /DNA_END=308 /DNA_ORIENTATION=-